MCININKKNKSTLIFISLNVSIALLFVLVPLMIYVDDIVSPGLSGATQVMDYLIGSGYYDDIYADVNTMDDWIEAIPVLSKFVNDHIAAGVLLMVGVGGGIILIFIIGLKLSFTLGRIIYTYIAKKFDLDNYKLVNDGIDTATSKEEKWV